MTEINPILSGLTGLTGPRPDPQILARPDAGGLSFKEVVKDFLSDTNQSQLEADRLITKSLTGEINDVHTVMVAATKAETSLRLLLEIRNRLMAAYQEIIRMQV